MRTRLVQLWERLRASYWFIPSLLAVGAAILAVITEGLDRTLALERVEELQWLLPAGPEGARALFTTIAGSMITVTGVVFSITMVALVLASSQFGPRLLENFMSDRGNQVVLGTFVATFLFCLISLRNVSAVEGSVFVPRLTAVVAVGLTLASIAVLIYFFDHIATSIQAPAVARRVTADLFDVIDRTFPGEDATRGETGGRAENAPAGAGSPPDPGAVEGESGTESQGRRAEGEVWTEVPSPRDGYVQILDLDGLVEAATDLDVVCRVMARPGDFVLQGAPLLRFRPALRTRGQDGDAQGTPEGRVGEEGAPETDEDSAAERGERLRKAVALGSGRTKREAVSFAFRQLVEIAVRALSPGVNDPFTACDCLDGLGSALAEVARRPRPPDRLVDDEGRTRVLLEPFGFRELAAVSFDQIRLYGRSSLAVLVQLERTIAAVARHAHREADLRVLRSHADATREAAREGDLLPFELDEVERAHREAVDALAAASRRRAGVDPARIAR